MDLREGCGSGRGGMDLREGVWIWEGVRIREEVWI